MLIIVSDDVLKKALKPSDNDNDQAVETLRHLAWAIRKNHHLVYFPTINQTIINQLASILNGNDMAAIRHSFSKKQDLHQIEKLVQFSIIVSFNSEIKRDENTLWINPSRDSLFELSEECHLLTENLLDAEFYRYFAIAFQKKNRIEECAFRTSFYSLQGGGATSIQVYLYECSLSQHLCLAILDSDKKWPNYNGFGPTATTFEDGYNMYVAKNGVPHGCHYYIMTNTNEVENLIPSDVLAKFSSPSQQKFIRKNGAVLPWLDIKKGLDYRWLYVHKEAFREWSSVLKDEIDWTQLSSIMSASTNDLDFENRVSDSGFAPIVQPWGSSIMDKVLHPDIKHQNKYDLKKVDFTRLTINQQSEWNEIGRLVFNWCCCFGKKLY